MSDAALHEAASARLRNLSIDRLLRMNARHATHAWLQRRARPVGPHGLAFLYADQLLPDQHADVAAATRLVDDGEDVRNLPRLLYRLTTLARERYLPNGGFDPRATLANRTDPMSAAATYIGLGVSSLDTFDASWADNQRAAAGPLDLPGRCFVLLTDGSMMLVERGGRHVFGEVRVTSTHDLNVEPGIASRHWKRRTDLHTVGATAEIWRRLYDLHELAAWTWPNPRSY